MWRACLVAVILSVAGCTRSCKPTQGPQPQPAPPARGAYVVDSGGRVLESVEAGSSLVVGARGLEPYRAYELRLTLDGAAAPTAAAALSFARLTSSRAGEIAPFVLWYHLGVVGCSDHRTASAKARPNTYRSFEEAERALAGRRLTVSVYPMDADPSGRTPLLQLRVGAAVSTIEVPVVRRRSPMLFPSTPEGCLRNGQEVGRGDLYASGLNFPRGQKLLVAAVANQRAWHVGDPIVDATGQGAQQVQVGADGSFTVKLWDVRSQRRGAYDLVAHVATAEKVSLVGAQDIVSYGSDTAFLLFLRYPPGGSLMDIAGRPLSRRPYFEFSDSFAVQGDVVWGAVDPTYVPAGHSGGTYAAYYVIAHRGVAGWDPSQGGSTALADVTGNVEVMPVKAGCINGTDIPIWDAPSLPVGDYDVVVDFGATAAETQPAYTPDGDYNAAVDFLDGADQIGFSVAPDPYELGAFPIGRATYSQDDFLATLGGASNVDLRAVVRYPATVAGDNTPVAAGAHPLFVIEHGNHSHCTCRDPATANPMSCSLIPWGSIANCADLLPYLYTHAACPQRWPNHEGYMRLLDILASHGIIAVSIDAYDLTGSGCLVQGWIPERGLLILKHLELWSHMNNPATYPAYPDLLAGAFAGRVDLGKIAVSGHSRGGEASVSAFVQNPAGSPFTIRAVSSIAPVDFQGYALATVPYFVILPAADCDVSNLSGQRIYDRAGSTTADNLTKSGVHVYGANHNFFNTVWAADGDDCGAGAARPDYILPADQQRLGEAYLAAFNRSQLLGENIYEDVLRGRLRFPSTAGFKAYAIRHEAPHQRVESGAGTGSATDMTATSVVSFTPPHLTQALRCTWPNGAAARLTYTLPVGSRDLTTYEVLSLRVAQSNNAANPASGSQDFLIELTGGGKAKDTYAALFGQIPRPYDRPGADHNVMTTIRVPLHSFIVNKSGVTLQDVDTLRFTFSSPPQGEIYVDDIEFSR